MAIEASSPRIVELIAEIADRLLPDADEIVGEMNRAQLEFVPLLGADPAIAAEVSASNRATLVHWLGLVGRTDATQPIDVPPEALDVVRTVARRGMEFDVIFQAYRRGQEGAWQRWMECASGIVEPGPELIEVLAVSRESLSKYVDEVLVRILAEARREREKVLDGELAQRIETVRLILDGAAIDSQTASRRLGYELDRSHTAVVLWTDSDTASQGALESAATLLARAAGARRPLTMPAGVSTLWAWLGSEGEPSTQALREAIAESDPELSAAVGPARHGITGFRSSHAGAVAVHRLLVANPGGERLASYRELEITALVAQDHLRAAEFVATTLGALAADEPTAARLRETLRVFLDEAENAPRAAARLDTHRNTVHQRVARATEMLGRKPGDDRLAIELALELARRLGPQVLLSPPSS